MFTLTSLVCGFECQLFFEKKKRKTKARRTSFVKMDLKLDVKCENASLHSLMYMNNNRQVEFKLEHINFSLKLRKLPF